MATRVGVFLLAGLIFLAGAVSVGMRVVPVPDSTREAGLPIPATGLPKCKIRVVTTGQHLRQVTVEVDRPARGRCELDVRGRW